MSAGEAGCLPELEIETRLRSSEAECSALRARLEEAEAVLQAIRSGEVDAVMVAGADGPQVFTLEGAEQPYRIMVESMTEGAATLLTDGTVAYANTRLAALLRIPLERLLGQSLRDFLAAADAERFTETCACSGPRFDEFELRTADGAAVPARIALTPLPRPSRQQGTPALCLVATDLTDSRRHTELAAAISERLNAKAALRSASQQKDVFLAMLAHELRNPLAPIRKASALLMRMVGADPSVQALTAMIARQTDQLTRLVDDLLDVSRIAQNRMIIRKEPLDIGAIVDQALETVQPLMSAKFHRLQVTRPSEPLYVRGDRARLAQSLSNLLHNAAKYTDPGGSIALAVRASADQVCFEVRDNGCGIDAALLPHVFDAFVQGACTLDRAQGGLGIGLSLVRGLVEMHGGSVDAASDGPRRGAVFTIRLPRGAPPETTRTGDAHPVVPQRRILVVDDNVDAADSLALLLRSKGHEVQVAYSAEAALESAASSRPDFILLDIGLPGTDGYQIAVTGYGQASDRQRTHEAGFDDHLVKPVELPALDRILAGPAAGATPTGQRTDGAASA